MAKNKKLILRIFLLGFIMLGLLAIAKYTPLGIYFSFDKLQEVIKDAGNWGMLIFFVISLVGTFMSVPGAVFIVFAILTYGYVVGILLSYITALICAMLNFYFARLVGGQSLAEIKNKRIQRILRRVDTHPIKTICWLRIFTLLSPIVNYALALTNIKASKFWVGNAIATIPPFILIIVTTVFFRSDFFKEVFLVWLESALG